MEVEFEFLLDEHQYRVIRKRQRRGKTSLSDLQFAVLTADGYRPLTERSVDETEQAIKRTLRMSYETFVSSSFIQQGRADSFTTSTPGERKRVLAEILELGYYDELEARAKHAYDQREARLWEERRVSREWEQEIARRPEYEAAVESLQRELDTLGGLLAELINVCNDVRGLVARLESEERQLTEARERLARHAAERDRVRGQLGDYQSRLAQVQAVLDRADEVEQAARTLAEVRGALSEADARLHAYMPLAQELERAKSAIATERTRLEVEVASRQRQLAELVDTVRQGRDAGVQLRRVAAVIESLVKAHRRQQSLHQAATEARETVARHRASNTHLKEQMQELRLRLDGLDGLAHCPVCERPVEPKHREQLRVRYESRGMELRTRFRDQEQVCLTLTASLKRYEAEERELELQLAGREEAQRQLALLEGQALRAHEAAQRQAALGEEVEQLNETLAQERFAVEARAALTDLEARMVALGYDAAAHAALRKRATQLASAEGAQQRLEQARLLAEHLTQQIGELSAALERAQADCAADLAVCERLEGATPKLVTERERLQGLDADVRKGQVAQGELRVRHTQAVGQVDACRVLEGKLRESVARQDQLMREHAIYSDLAHAFGRKGVQAMIIETALPEIEDEANRLLARMSEGRLHVKLESQREARTGGTIETLDIKIGDELGTRSYELFSGGESFRVNFALRIALSRLLAKRAGTRLQTLVIDEGFGSQDQQGRDRIVEAIQAIQEDFSKILVITHLEELRDRFPVRIDVRKTENGSTYALR
jgi:exonuclease SbcC